MPPVFAFPPPLLDAYPAGTVAVLFGSGLSIAKDVRGGFPRWTELPERLLEQAAQQGVWSLEQIDSLRSFLRGGYVPLEEMLTGVDMIKTALRGARN